MIGMRVGDYGAVRRAPRIEVKAAGRAKQSRARQS
jgi:hypothetical protein